MSYSKLKKKIQPLDLIFFNGGEFVSKSIRFLVKKNIKGKHDAPKQIWTHVGLVVTHELYDDPRLERGALYVLESTMSGKRGDGVNDIGDSAFLGVQLRRLDDLVEMYVSKKDMEIGWARMNDNPFRVKDDEDDARFAHTLVQKSELRAVFTSWCIHRWEGTRYDLNLISLGGSMYSSLRPLRKIVELILNTDEWLFCSELVFTVLQVLDFYGREHDPKNVLPMDLVGYDMDETPIPVLFKTPTEITRVN